MIDRLPHTSPKDCCGCVVCDAAHLVRWRGLSGAQRRALATLDPAIPRHIEDLRRKGIRRSTFASVMQARRHVPALVQQLDLRRPLADAPYYQFLLLSTRGADMIAAVRKAGLGV